MELYSNESVRKRLSIMKGNPILKTEAQVAEYNNLCENVEKHDITQLVLDKTRIEVVIGGKTTRVNYVKSADAAWVVQKISYIYKKHMYDFHALALGFMTQTAARSKGFVNAIQYALNMKCKIDRAGDNVVLYTDDLHYVLNLNIIAYDQRLEVDKLFKIRKLEDIARQRKLI